MIHLRPLLIALGFAVWFPHSAQAALVVDFSSAPLFAEADLLPGDAVSRTVTVTNTGVESELVEFDFENVINGPLAIEMELVVDSGGTVYVDDTFATLFAGGAFSLGTLNQNQSRTYRFTAALPPAAKNPLQAETFGFDLRIGFTGQESVSDRARAFTGGSRTLELFNEAVTLEDSLGGAFVTWNSNRPASTYLVCGAVVDGPYTLIEEPPLFGYQFALEEELERVERHGVALTELAPEEYECRPAGRTRATAGFTVGDPVRFTIPGPAGAVAGVNTNIDPAAVAQRLAAILESRPQSSVLGVGSKGAGNLTYEEFRAELEAAKRSVTDEEVATATTPERNSEVVTESDGDATATASDPRSAADDDGVVSTWLIVVLLLVLGTLTTVSYLRART